MDSENEVYGNRKILCDYASVPSGSRILGRLQHGWVADNEYETLIRNSLVDSYVWTKLSEKYLRDNGIRNVHAIGAPWLYMLRLLSRLGYQVEKEKISRPIDELWIFGGHSVTKTESLSKISELIEFLNAANSSEARNKLVLLFYVDYFALDKQIKERYQNLTILTTLTSRLRTSTAESHLFNLFHIFSQSKTIVLDYPTTAMLYGLSLGCGIRWYHHSNFVNYRNYLVAQKKYELVHLMDNDDLSPEEKISFSLKKMGNDDVRDPEELRELFLWENLRINYRRRFLKSSTDFCKLPLRLNSLRKFDA